MNDEQREIPNTAAEAWVNWAHEFGEEPTNPQRGTWAALRHSFYGGMFMAIVMTFHKQPNDNPRVILKRAKTLHAELRQWADSDETYSSADVSAVRQEWIDEVWHWLHEQMLDPNTAMMVWAMMEPDEDGGRQMPELGFAPQLGQALVALRAIARCNFPRHDDPSGSESSVELSTELRMVAGMTLQKLEDRSSGAEDDDASWRLPL